MPMELIPMPMGPTPMLLLFPLDPALVLTPSPRELPSLPTTLARDLLMLMPITDTTMELTLMPMVLILMLLLFPSAPALVLTPSPRELPSLPTTLARDLLMLMPTMELMDTP